jgi:hypothetical protein
VLLGDAIELRQGPLREAFASARPFFEALGERIGDGGEVVLVPGNHDHQLVAPWLDRRACDGAPPPLALAQTAELGEHDPVAALAQWCGPARFSLAYPGIWLRDDVYATHGHYLDRHTTVPTFERLGAGAMGKLVGEVPRRDAGPDDYEAALAPLYAWIHAVAQQAGERAGTHGASARAWRTLSGSGSRTPLRRRLLASLFPFGIAAINRTGIGPLHADVSAAELRRAGVRAMAETVARLQVPAAYVIFGHTHRAGPRAEDDAGDWSSAGGAHLLNTGSWVYEPHFAGTAPYASPYWPGHAVLVEEEFPLAPPRTLRLLGDRGPAELEATPRRRA